MSMSSAGYAKRRSPTVAGIFYPDDPEAVETALSGFDSAKAETARGAAAAIIAPHAGWDLSGQVAADAFRSAEGRDISTVVLIGPLHQDKNEGLFLSESDYFETPIGDIAVDKELCAELESCGTFFITNDIPHLEEHSIEILLPFVKRRFPRASIVPILTGGVRPSVVKTLARSVDLVFGPIADSTLIVVSTNLCANLASENANEHSERFLALLEQADHEALLEGARTGTISACGVAGCAALLQTELIGALPAMRLSLSDSSERQDYDPRKLVRYGAFSFG